MSSFQPLAPTIVANVDTTAQQYTYPVNFFTTAPGVNCDTFLLNNPNNFYVRALSSRGSYVAVTSTTGVLLPPNAWGVFGTTQPDYLSCMSVTHAGLTAGSGIVSIAYGTGD